jgi:hypothetical protein
MTVTSLAAAPVRSAVLYSSQSRCQVSAELEPDVKTVANRTDSVLTFHRSLNMRHEKSVKSKVVRVVVPLACDDSSGERQSSGEAQRSSPGKGIVGVVCGEVGNSNRIAGGSRARH